MYQYLKLNKLDCNHIVWASLFSLNYFHYEINIDRKTGHFWDSFDSKVVQLVFTKKWSIVPVNALSTNLKKNVM